MVKLFHFKQHKRLGVRGDLLSLLLTVFLIFTAFHPVGPVKNQVIKIVIDPGHGGRDPGTIGRYTEEKNIALAISLMVGKYLEKHLENIEVIYTRTNDSFVHTRKRPDIANRANADLFVSIHANSLPEKTPTQRKAIIKGIEVYVMGVQNTKRALEVAKRENSVILLEEDYEEYYDFDPQSEESYILFNLTQSAYQENSLLLASMLDNQLTNRAGRRSYGVKQSSLYVLWNTAMPSVLVEVGYLSNPQEEVELNDPNVQSYIASGIFRAIREYKVAIESQN